MGAATPKSDMTARNARSGSTRCLNVVTVVSEFAVMKRLSDIYIGCVCLSCSV